MIRWFANPGRFLKLAAALNLPVAVLAALCITGGMYWALFVSPPDYQQKDAVRIMYVHVPAAWLSMMVYVIVAAMSFIYLVWRHTVADVIAAVSAPIGAVFTGLTLITGSIWGKPMWNTWWVWDARLTSVLILFFIYLGYLYLRHTIDEAQKAATISGVFAIFGLVNLPIIKFSVEWWNTLHQPASIVRFGGPTIHESMLWPLLMMGLGFTFFYGAVMLAQARAWLLRQKSRRPLPEDSQTTL